MSYKHLDPELHELAQKARIIQDLALNLGAKEVVVSIGSSVSNERSQRNRLLEKCEQSRSMGISVRLLVDGRYSVHSASDPNPKSMKPFLKRAIDSTRYLEQDPHRHLLPRDEMSYSDVSDLKLFDSSWHIQDPENRNESLCDLEEACLHEAEQHETIVRSITAHVWDSYSKSVMLFSNGHSCGWSRTSFGKGAELTLVEQRQKADGSQIERLPEAYDFYSARQLSSLPKNAEIASSLFSRGKRRIASGPIQSQKIPIILENRAAGRILGMILSPLSGGSIYEKRSCMMNRRNTTIGSSSLTIYDDPLVPMGLASSPYTADGQSRNKTPLITNGVLNNYLLSLYNARRLNMSPTTGGSTSNIVIDPGSRSEQELLKSLPKAARIEGFLGGNANALTGDFSYGITGTYFEYGEPVSQLSEMNISGNLFSLLESYLEPASNTWTFSSYRTPSLLFDAAQLSGI